jgi:hypothetical protein
MGRRRAANAVKGKVLTRVAYKKRPVDRIEYSRKIPGLQFKIVFALVSDLNADVNIKFKIK